MASTSTERVRAMRARRRQALNAASDAEAALRDADSLLGPAIEETLAALELDGKDAAAAQLARQCARLIDRASDQAWALRWLGPELARVLAQLGATPMARAKQAAKPQRRPPSKLDALRVAHAQAFGPASRRR